MLSEEGRNKLAIEEEVKRMTKKKKRKFIKEYEEKEKRESK